MKDFISVAAQRNIPKNLLVFLILLFLSLLIYSNTLKIPFQYDDKLSVQHNMHIRSIGNVSDIWEVFNTRFLVGLSYAFNYFLGGLNVAGYRLFNIFIHGTASFLVYWLIILTFQTQRFKESKFSESADLIALSAALIFLSHPVQNEAVNLITQRFASMAAMFYLFSLCFYVKARLSDSYNWLTVSIVCAISAMFSKENTITLPFAVLLYEVYFLGPHQLSLKRKITFLVPFFILLPIIPLNLLKPTFSGVVPARIASISKSPGETTPYKIDITKAAGALLSRKEYALTELNVMRTYFRLLFLPVNQNLDYDYPTTKTLVDTRTFFSIFLIGALFFIAYGTLKPQRIISFGILWFFLTMSVESSVIPIGHVISEYRLYLPLFGFALIVSMGLLILLKEPKKVVIAVSLIVIILSFLTYRRNQAWQSQISLWEDTVKKSPNKPRPWINLGTAYIEAGQQDNAVESFKRVIVLSPNDIEAHLNIGVIHAQKGETQEAIRNFEKVIELNPHIMEAYFNLGTLYGSQGDYEKEIAYYQKALKLDPNYEEVYINLGIAYADNRQKAEALKQVSMLRVFKRADLADRLEEYINNK